MRGPKRPRLLLDDWPQDDRDRWSRAFRFGDVFDEQGPGAQLAERTRNDLRHHYECWLGFLAARYAQVLEEPAGLRVTVSTIEQLVTERRKTCRETSVVSDLRKLRYVLVLLCPECDWSWLLAIIKRLESKAEPLPPKHNLVTSEVLYTLGKGLMDQAKSSNERGQVTRNQALQYRDGLLIALLATIPLRRRTLTALRIGVQLVKDGACWALDIPPQDTKCRKAIECPLPPGLWAYIDEYLSRFRPRIPGANKHDSLWASNKARSMDDGAIYDMVCRRTRHGVGFPVNLHRFRTAAVTLWATHDPANVLGAKDLLGHGSFATTEGHYIAAQSRLAGRALSNVIDGYETDRDDE